MAELASALPTSGAMYHWSSAGRQGMGLVHRVVQHNRQYHGHRGNRLRLRAVRHASSRTRSDDGNLLIVYGVILLSHALINHFGIRLVAWLNDLSVTVHIVGVIAIVAALFIFAPKQPRVSFSRASQTTRRLALLVGVHHRVVAGAMDLHRLRRIGQRIGRDSRSAPPRPVGDGVGRRGIERRRIFAADRIDACDQRHLRHAQRQGRQRQPFRPWSRFWTRRSASAREVVFGAGRDGDVVLRVVGGDMVFASHLGLRARQGVAGVGFVEARQPHASTPVSAIWLCVIAAFLGAVYSRRIRS